MYPYSYVFLLIQVADAFDWPPAGMICFGATLLYLIHSYRLVGASTLMHTVTHLLQACFTVHVGRCIIAIFSTHVGIFLSWYVPFQYLLLVVSQQ